MKLNKMASFIKTFREKQYDEEGNLIVNKKTGQPVYAMIPRIVRHNPGYKAN
jgi:hypothetical protein